MSWEALPDQLRLACFWEREIAPLRPVDELPLLRAGQGVQDVLPAGLPSAGSPLLRLSSGHRSAGLAHPRFMPQASPADHPGALQRDRPGRLALAVPTHGSPPGAANIVPSTLWAAGHPAVSQMVRAPAVVKGWLWQRGLPMGRPSADRDEAKEADSPGACHQGHQQRGYVAEVWSATSCTGALSVQRVA